MINNRALEEEVGIKGFFLDFPGIGGIIKASPEDFIVREILPNGSVITDGSEIGNDVGGMYIHFILWKRGIDTYSAIKKIAHFCRLNEGDFGYAGLKDAQAESYQRVSVWIQEKKCLERVNIQDIKILNPIRQKFAIARGDLAGNQFNVVIRDPQRNITVQQWHEIRKEVESDGFLNFFGLQRFGSKRPILHLIGKHILRTDYSDAIDTYIGSTSNLEYEKITKLRQLYRTKRSFEEIYNKFPNSYAFERLMLTGLIKKKKPEGIIRSLPKYFSRLAISAYQSFIFNRILHNILIKKTSIHPNLELPLLGYSTDLTMYDVEIRELIDDFLSKDGLIQQSFKHEYKNFQTKGTQRTAIVKPNNFKVINYFETDKKVQLQFELPKGSYATIFLREIMK
jgi:tRNA pseudouridine13 synthase